MRRSQYSPAENLILSSSVCPHSPRRQECQHCTKGRVGKKKELFLHAEKERHDELDAGALRMRAGGLRLSLCPGARSAAPVPGAGGPARSPKLSAPRCAEKSLRQDLPSSSTLVAVTRTLRIWRRELLLLCVDSWTLNRPRVPVQRAADACGSRCAPRTRAKPSAVSLSAGIAETIFNLENVAAANSQKVRRWWLYLEDLLGH